MHFYKREHSRMCLPVCVWVSSWSHNVCFPVSHHLLQPSLAPPCWLPEAAGSICSATEWSAGWGIITRAIKERFTGQPVSGVSMVPHPPACTVLGDQPKAQNRESGASRERDDLNMKVRDVAALVASALWSESQRPRGEITCHLIFR